MAGCSIIRNKETNEIERVLAPNGQDSSLFKSLANVVKDKEIALRQWAQTYTPSFTNWFGNWQDTPEFASKVVDENGEPLVVFHGTNHDFSIFNTDQKNFDTLNSLDDTFFFTSSYKQAQTYGHRIVPVFLNMRNPARKSASGEYLDDMDRPVSEALMEIGKAENPFVLANPEMANMDGVINEIGNEGFQIVKGPNAGTFQGVEEQNVFVVFNPDQIKSTENEGGFSVFDNDIYMQASHALESTPADEVTMAKVRSLLKGIGFTDEMVQSVEDIEVDGVKVSANGLADIANKVIQVAQGKENIALPEEAMHFVVELLQYNRPDLFKQLMANVTSFKLYKDLLKDPEYTSQYRTASGALDINKLKKEAIAKILVEFVVKQKDPREYEEDEVRTMRNVWLRILDFLRDLFRGKDNPFKTITDAIQEENYAMFGDVSSLPQGTGEVFYSMKLSDRDAKYKKSKAILDAVRNKLTTYKISKKDDQYYKEQKEHNRRVSDEVDKYYTKKFGAEKNFPEHLKALYELSREDGNLIHSVIETIINQYVDKETGLLRDRPHPTPGHITTDSKSNAVYKILHDNIVERLSEFPEGTRFSAEQIIYNENTDKAGTIDLLVIDPEGEVSVFDWKSLIYQDYTKIFGLKDYKREAFDVQMKEYRDILKSYGINNFGYMRMIPISKLYTQDKKTKEWRLSKLTIGSATPREITDKDEHLKPFVSSIEKTGNRKLDNFIEALRKQVEDIKIKSKGKDYTKTAEAISQIYKIIYDIQAGENNEILLENLNRYIATQTAEVENVINKADTIKKSDNKQVNSILTEIRFVRNSLTYMKQAEAILDIIKGKSKDDFEFTEYTEGEPEELERLIKEAENKIADIDDLEKELLDTLAKSHKILGILVPERVMNLWQKFARSTSQGTTAAIQLLYKLTESSFHKSTFDLDERHKKISELKYKVDQEAKKKGISTEKYMDKLFKKNKKGEFNGHFISEVDSEFFKQRDIVMQWTDKDAKKKWFLENYRIEDYHEWYQEKLQERMDQIEENTYGETPAQDKARKKFMIDNFRQQFDIFNHPETAMSSANTAFWNNFINIKKWPSKEYQEVAKDKVLLEAFNYFRSVNKELRENGLLQDQNMYTFIPNIRRGLAESITGDDKNLKRLIPFNSFLNDIKATDEGMYFGKVDPRTGQKVDELNVRFTNDTFAGNYKEKSKDLFASYYLMSHELVQFQYLSEIDAIAQSLLHIEKTKGSIDKAGQLVNDNTENLKALEQQVKGLIYRQTLQTGEGVAFSYNYNKFVETWNKGFLGKIKKLKEIENGQVTISGTKLAMKLNNYNAVRALSGNLKSALAGVFGGTASTYLLGSRYFYQSDLTEAMMRMQSSAWYATDDMKKRAALVDFFLPLIENNAGRKQAQLSVAKASTLLSGEWMMDLQRKGDEFIQLNIFLATIENFTVQDGKIVSIRDIIEKKNGYAGRFNLPQDQRRALEKKVKDEVIEYRKKNSLANQAKYEKRIVNGKEEVFITLPGIERSGEETMNLRRLVQNITKDAIGNVSDTDISNYKLNLIMRLFAAFKNWIPRTGDVRWGEFRYEIGKDSWEYGRYRMAWKMLGGNVLMSAAKLVPLLGRGIARFENQDYIIQRAREIYEQKKQETMDAGLYSEETFITEDVFIQSFIEGVNSTFTEMRNAFMLIALIASALLTAGPDDDDETKNFKKTMAKLVDKLTDEISFFYSPNSFLDIMGTKPLPVFSLITDSTRVVRELSLEVFGMTFDNEEWVDSAKPAKYIFRMFPISKEVISYIPIIDPELGKEMGIQLSNRSRNQ